MHQTITISDEDIRARLATLVENVAKGTGNCAIDMAISQFNGLVRGYATGMSADDAARVIAIAEKDYGYAEFEPDYDDNSCGHGIAKGYCPVGCGEDDDLFEDNDEEIDEDENEG